VTIRSATIVGGGPAGLIAAEVLVAAGLAVTVYDHMPSAGRKLLLAGRGGLNITNSESIDAFLDRYGAAVPHLEEAIRAFGPPALRAWCAELGERTFIGTSGRVFPQSLRATPLLRAWLVRLAAAGVTFVPRHRWIGWSRDSSGAIDSRRLRFTRADMTRTEVVGHVSVFALGGASWPRVGSDGGWVEPFLAAGIAVNPLRPSNSGMRIAWTESFAKRFGGVPLKNIAISANRTVVRGDAMITSAGLEGGPIYAHSAVIRDEIDRNGRCRVTVDLHPDLTEEAVRERLVRRRPKESLTTSLRRTLGLAPVAIALIRESTGNDVPSDPSELVALVKAVPIVIEATMPIDRAISSAGGVSFAEINDAFMVKRLPGTFVAGEMLDWEAPTGGYLLQASFSTGVAAARGALAWLDESQL
jgi:uncharacterized flavoprotein (TIGR03862 family)